jgi:hypothetical protein
MRTLENSAIALSLSLCVAAIACGNETPVTVTSGGTGGNGNKTASGGNSHSSNQGSLGGNGSVSRTTASGGNAAITASVNMSGNTTPTDVQCAQNQVPIEILPPEILIVMDRSTSMTYDQNGEACAGAKTGTGNGNCGDTSKWHQSIEAVKSIVQETQTKVSWGMFWLGNEATECGVSKTPVVPITARESFDPIQSALDGNAFTGKSGTPTALAVKNAVAYLKTLTEPNPKFLLVATDGEPNCIGGKSGTTSDTAGATAAVEAAAQANIPTFVVGIATTSSDVATTALNSMAKAGGRAQTGAATDYYAVSDTAGLVATLKDIINQASSCTISLENTPKGEWKIAISAKDTSGQAVLIPADETDGWIYDDPNAKTSITLVGSACEKLKNGDYSNVQFVYTCPGRDIVL